jgi:hypothetical protein
LRRRLSGAHGYSHAAPARAAARPLPRRFTFFCTAMGSNGDFLDALFVSATATAVASPIPTPANPNGTERALVTASGLDNVVRTWPSSQIETLDEWTRFLYVQPATSIPNAWAGSETTTDFIVPPGVDILNSMSVFFQCDASGSTVALAAPYALNRVEIYCGSDLIETIQQHQLYQTLLFSDDTELFLRAQQWNVQTVANSPYAGATTTFSSTGNVFSVPINSILKQSQFFIPGASQQFRIRVAWAPSWTTSGGFILRQAQLRLGHQVLSNESRLLLMNAYRLGTVSHRVVSPRVHNEAQSSWTSGTQYNVVLRSLPSNASAGLIVDIVDQSTTPALVANRYNFAPSGTALTLLDAGGNRVTDSLDLGFNTEAWYKSIGSQYRAISMVIPFSRSMKKSYLTGAFLGARSMQGGQSQLQVVSGGGTANPVIVRVTSYDYAMLVCSRGVVTFSWA